MFDESLTNVIEELEWDNDDGLKNLWGLYYMCPKYSFLQQLRKEGQLDSDLEDELKRFAVSPHWKHLRDKATRYVKKQAERVYEQAKKQHGGELKVGDIVLVPVNNVDRTKVDGAGIVGVVVESNEKHASCCVAVNAGVLNCLYVYHKLRAVAKHSNDRMLNGLEEVFQGWMVLPKITEREAARSESIVGRQGMRRCNCKGECNANRCACRKANQECNSQCHKGNVKCKKCIREFHGSVKKQCQPVVPAVRRKKHGKKKCGVK